MATNNETKCGIIYEKIAMRAGDDERMINYEWSCQTLTGKMFIFQKETRETKFFFKKVRSRGN